MRSSVLTFYVDDVGILLLYDYEKFTEIREFTDHPVIAHGLYNDLRRFLHSAEKCKIVYIFLIANRTFRFVTYSYRC